MSTENKKLEQEVDYAHVAAAIRKMGDVGKAMHKSGLSQRAIVLLLHDITNVGKNEIKYILNALPELPRMYLRKDVATAPPAKAKP